MFHEFMARFKGHPCPSQDSMPSDKVAIGPNEFLMGLNKAVLFSMLGWDTNKKALCRLHHVSFFSGYYFSWKVP